MISLSLLFGISILYSGYCEDTTEATATSIPTTTIKPDGISENFLVLNETITKYGPPKNYMELGLPGPEIATDYNKNKHNNTLESDKSGDHYILKVRTITKYFSYNARYEECTLKRDNDTVIPNVKGQFTEHFERKSGGFYIRSIGYTLDESGYKQFLIDLTVAQTNLVYATVPPIIGGGVPEGGQVAISPTVLATLTGGNSLG